jgi:type VI protein secretion system component Hcp
MASAFLKIPDVRGESSDPQHLGWIEALSFGHYRHGTNEVWITKTADSTSALLFQMAQDGRSFEGEIDAVDQGRIFLHFGLKGAVIAAAHFSAASGSDGAPVENLTLACQSIEVEVR